MWSNRFDWWTDKIITSKGLSGVQMNKCKDCKYFRYDCEFASLTDKQLGLDGNFVACGQFKKSSVIRDCLSCSNSFSEEGNKNGDILHCMEHNGKVVEDNFYCKYWNWLKNWRKIK